MNLPWLLSIFGTILFGLLTIILSFREEKTKKLLKEREEKHRQQLYQITILEEIQDRIGYELDIERIVDVITGSLRNFFAYSTASSLLLKEDRLVFKTYLEEKVSRNFIEHVKQAMLASLSAILGKPPALPVNESISGVMLDDKNTLPPASFFHIPLIVNDKVVGLINISSQKPGLYKESAMTVLYQIAHQAASALSRLEQVLTTEKGKIMAVIQSLSDGIFMVDGQNRLLVINEAAKRLLGVTSEKPTTLEVFAKIEGNLNISAKISQAISSGLSAEEKEVRLNDKIVYVLITPVFDTTEKRVIGASVLLHDITLEKNLAQLKEDFTNMVVHELRAPLTSIRGASELLLDKSEPQKAEDKELLNIIHSQSKKLLEDVSSLLDAAKLEAGKFTIQKSLTDLKRIIEEKIEEFLPVAKTKRVELVGKIDEDLPNTKIDAVHIGQVLNNLISNSLKFTPEGGRIEVRTQIKSVGQKTQNARISDESENQKIRDSEFSESLTHRPSELSEFSEFIRISVSDTGVGIPKEKQGELFSKFSQLAHKEEGGTGLGLYISKGIIEAHGGTIWLESEQGRGTTVSFTLPVTELTEHQAHEPSEPIPLSKTLHTVVN